MKRVQLAVMVSVDVEDTADPNTIEVGSVSIVQHDVTHVELGNGGVLIRNINFRSVRASVQSHELVQL